MRVIFAGRLLQRCYERETFAIRAWGPIVGRRYIQRVSLLRDAASLEDLFAARSLRLHPLKGARHGEWALSLSDRWRLLIDVIDDHTVRVKEVNHHYGD